MNRKWKKLRNEKRKKEKEKEKKGKKEKKTKKKEKDNYDWKETEEMNPKLQQLYGFLKEFALDHDQRPWREKSIWATLAASFGARTLNASRVASEIASNLEWNSVEGKVKV